MTTRRIAPFRAFKSIRRNPTIAPVRFPPVAFDLTLKLWYSDLKLFIFGKIQQR